MSLNSISGWFTCVCLCVCVCVLIGLILIIFQYSIQLADFCQGIASLHDHRIDNQAFCTTNYSMCTQHDSEVAGKLLILLG